MAAAAFVIFAVALRSQTGLPQPAAPSAEAAANAPAQSQIPQWQIDAGGHMSFDVASIKLHPWDVAAGSYMPHTNFRLGADDAYAATGGLLLDENLPVASYIVFAYKLTPDQRTGMVFPRWGATDHFDIEARGPASATKDQMRLMMQSLLADRFKLAAHWEDKQVPVFSVVLVKEGKTGPELKLHTGAPCVPTNTTDLHCGGVGMLYLPNGEYQVKGEAVTMQQLASGLRFEPGTGIDRPLIDGTGLPGKLDFTMVWVPDTRPGPGQPAQDVSGPSYIEALNDQLGLKLVPSTGPSHYLVIDHIEEPTPN